MTGWRRSGGSGPLTWMRSSGTWTAWGNRHRAKPQQRRGRHATGAAQTANITKEARSENQVDERIRKRPGQGPALLYGRTGLCQEGRFQPGAISLADGGVARG